MNAILNIFNYFVVSLVPRPLFPPQIKTGKSGLGTRLLCCYCNPIASAFSKVLATPWKLRDIYYYKT